MGDDKGAFEAFEQALAIDSTDDELRARYAALAAKLGRWIDAAKTLGRVLATVKDPAVKAKAGAQLGEMLLRGGEPKRAKTTLAGVLATPDAPADAVLPAARALREILETEKDPKALCDVRRAHRVARGGSREAPGGRRARWRSSRRRSGIPRAPSPHTSVCSAPRAARRRWPRSCRSTRRAAIR